MRHLLTILAALFLCAAPAQAQTLKALMYNTTNGNVVYNSLNSLRFTNEISFAGGNTFISVDNMGIYLESDNTNTPAALINFVGDGADRMAQNTRANLGFSTNLNTLWTATSASNARTAIELGVSNAVRFEQLFATDTVEIGSLTNTIQITTEAIEFGHAGIAAATRTNLGLGATNNVTFNSVNTAVVYANTFESINYGTLFDIDGTNTINMQKALAFSTNIAAATRTNLGLGSASTVVFAGLTNNGDIRINQTTASNGLLYIYRTNNEPFLGLANLIASNNTTVSNETLFRVGVAEATNRSAQFGFRSTNTNGNGVAVFSVFGFNALMQIGADASTNAVIYSGGGTNNEVMTLIRDGATEFARPLRFSTNASTRPATNAPANTTNVAAWVEMRIGTNSYRVQLFQ